MQASLTTAITKNPSDPSLRALPNPQLMGNTQRLNLVSHMSLMFSGSVELVLVTQQFVLLSGIQCGPHLSGSKLGSGDPGVQVRPRLCWLDSRNHHTVHPGHIWHHLSRSPWKSLCNICSCPYLHLYCQSLTVCAGLPSHWAVPCNRVTSSCLASISNF